jgi:enoyl-CoA hydratase/carnithine racemase
MEPLVLYDKTDDGIALLTLNRPAALNAVNLAMRDELWGLLLAVRDDPDVRVAVLRGAGERALCAGADVKEFGSAASVIEARRARQERDLWGLTLEMETPFIAQIRLGAGRPAAK